MYAEVKEPALILLIEDIGPLVRDMDCYFRSYASMRTMKWRENKKKNNTILPNSTLSLQRLQGRHPREDKKSGEKLCVGHKSDC